MIHHTSFTLDQFTPISVYEKLKSKYNDEITFLFESADKSDGNYSIIIIGDRSRLQQIGSSAYLTQNNKKEKLDIDAFTYLKKHYDTIDFSKYQNYSKELGLGYIDGYIGFIAYDMVQVFEPILKSSMENLKDELQTADLDLILPEIVLEYSHKDHKITILTTLDTKKDEIKKLQNTLQDTYKYSELKKFDNTDNGSFAFSKKEFFEMVDKSKEMIKSGDVFQVLMTNRFTKNVDVHALSFYRILRLKNPSPYMYLLDFNDFQIVGSSPEVMVRLQHDEILLRPIAGTRKRGTTKQKDLDLEKELLADPKELSEHLMLIDLGRNDVGRVAEVGSVKVEDMMHIERFSHVMHIVSDVVAKLDNKKDMFDLFKATFTAGTMTGAPKIRAMELIAQFEGIKRGFYSGSIAYFGYDGNMDSAITIRTAMIKDKKVILHAGAGIVADSVNELEYQEVENKLGALVASLEDLAK